MKEIEKLFLQGYEAKEIIEMGYPKSTVYEVRRRLRLSDYDVIVVFKLLAQGKRLPEIVIETRLPPSRVKEIYKMWVELEELQGSTTRHNVENIPSSLFIVMRYMGEYKRGQCYFFNIESGLCMKMREKYVEPALSESGIFVYDAKRDYYYANVRDNPVFCALCHNFTPIEKAKFVEDIGAIEAANEDIERVREILREAPRKRRSLSL